MRASAAVFIIAAGSYIALFLGLIRSILVMRYVGVTGRGIMQIVFMLNRYTSNAHLGVMHGISKLLPLRLGAHNAEEAEEIEACGMSWVIVMTALVALGMCVVGILEPTEQRATGIAIAIGGGWLLTTQVYNLYRVVLRSWGNFRLLACLTVIDAVLVFGLGIGGAALWGFVGAMLGMLAAYLIDLMVLHFFSGIRIRPSLKLSVGYELGRVGFLIMLLTFSDTLLRTVDASIMAAYYDAFHVGLYSVGMQVASYMFALPEAAGFVIWPKVMEAWGATGDPAKMRRHIELPTVTAAFGMPLLAGVVHTLLPAAIYMVVPEFIGSIDAAQILTWAGIFLALPLAANSLLVASNREVTAIIVRAGCGLLLGGVTWWLVLHQAHITTIAYAAAGAYALSSAISLLLVLPHYYRGRELVVELAACYLPTVWAIASLRVGNNLAANLLTPAEGDILWSLLHMTFFVLLYTVGVVYAHYHIDLLNEVREFLNSRRQTVEELAASELEDDPK